MELPVVATTLQITRERDGVCSEVRAGRPGAHSALVMTDICHGWTTETCGDKLMVRGVGVVADQAQVLFTDANRAVDLAALVDRNVGTKWPGHEYLHLQFETGSCRGGRLTVRFNGSHIKGNSSGSADGMRGVVRIARPNDQLVSLEPYD